MMGYAIKVSGFKDDNYMIRADSEEIEIFPTVKDAEEELAWCESSGLALMGDCRVIEYLEES